MGRRKYRKELTPVNSNSELSRPAYEEMARILSRIKMRYPALIDAVNFLEPVEVREDLKCLCTDGRHIFYTSEWLDGIWDEKLVMGHILHIITHGLLGHFSKAGDYDKKQLSWDVMDLQVAEVLNEICYETCDLDDIFEDHPGFSLYYEAQKDIMLQTKIKKRIRYLQNCWHSFFDDHTTWALPKFEFKVSKGAAGGKGSPSEGQGSGDAWTLLLKDISGTDVSNISGGLPREVINALIRAIKDSELKTWGSSSGRGQGIEIKPDENGVLSYKNILDEVSRLCETTAEEDEIDPVIYEYGLDMYGDVPLIEPLDQKMIRQLSSVVIAIDTGGSCMGSLKEFRTETAQIFREIAENSGIASLHYIECDADIAYEKKYTDIEEMIKDTRKLHAFKGFGGTDFRPVFDKCREYTDSGESIDFLIYFSDGEGDYPKTDPGYPVYFVLPDKENLEWATPWMPAWVRKMVLEK